VITRIQSDDAYIDDPYSGNPYIGVIYSHDGYSDDGEHLAGSSGAPIIRPPQNSARPGARGQIRIAPEREAESPEPEAKSQLGGEPEEDFKMNRAEVCARVHLDEITKLIDAYETAVKTGEASWDGDIFDDATIKNSIKSYPLEVMVSSSWEKASSQFVSKKYCLLLQDSPRVRIVGEFDECSVPITAAIQFQDHDSGEWRMLFTTIDELIALLRFTYHFYLKD